MIDVLIQYCRLAAPPYSGEACYPFQILDFPYFLDVFFSNNTFICLRHISGPPPVVSRLQVIDYELSIHYANIVRNICIKIAVCICNVGTISNILTLHLTAILESQSAQIHPSVVSSLKSAAVVSRKSISSSAAALRSVFVGSASTLLVMACVRSSST